MEVTIGKHLYRSARLDARKQFHVGIKIGPAYAALSVARARASAAIQPVVEAEGEEAGDRAASIAMAEVFKVIAEALAAMSEKDLDFILNACLSVVQRQEGAVWANVMAPNGALMFEKEMNFPILMRLTMEVIKEDLGGFFAAPWAVLG